MKWQWEPQEAGDALTRRRWQPTTAAVAANSLRLQFSRHLNQTKPNQTKPLAFLPNPVSGGSQLNFAAGKPTTKHSAPLEFVCNREWTRDGDSPSTTVTLFFQQAGC